MTTSTGGADYNPIGISQNDGANTRDLTVNISGVTITHDATTSNIGQNDRGISASAYLPADPDAQAIDSDNPHQTHPTLVLGVFGWWCGVNAAISLHLSPPHL